MSARKIGPFLILPTGLLLVAYGCTVDGGGYSSAASGGLGASAGDGGSDDSAGGVTPGLAGGRSSGGKSGSGASVGSGGAAVGSGAAGGATATGGADSTGGTESEAGAGGEAPCVGPCLAGCTPGSAQCNDLQPQVCDANGEWLDLGTPCPALCEAGACIACVENATQCNALQPQTCNASGFWENTGTPCPYVCEADTGSCIGVCTPGAKQCDDLQPQECDENGEWLDTGSACAMVCNGGTCTACEPGDEQCNGLQPQSCDDDGKWEDEGSACEFLCDNAQGQCTGMCTPGAKQCDGLQPQVCDPTGTWEDSGMPCDFVCNNSSGTCSGSCVPTRRQCAGSQPQQCNANGVWEDSGAACGTCNPCSTSTGTCVVATGANCSDSNACTIGEKCLSNGTCDGGSTMSCPAPSNQCKMVGACVPASGCPAETNRTGSCSTNNPCKINETCSSGTCGGGTNVPKNDSCMNGRYCDGAGACKCRVKSSWNMLTNPGFDGNANNWTLNSPAAYNSANDADGCTGSQGSGSILLDALQATFRQCVSVGAVPSGGRTYYFGYRFKSNGGSGASGLSICTLLYLGAGNTCQVGEQTASDTASYSFNNNNWVTASAIVTAPAGTRNIIFNCSAPAASGYFDQLYLSETSPGSPPF